MDFLYFTSESTAVHPIRTHHCLSLSRIVSDSIANRHSVPLSISQKQPWASTAAPACGIRLSTANLRLVFDVIYSPPPSIIRTGTAFVPFTSFYFFIFRLGCGGPFAPNGVMPRRPLAERGNHDHLRGKNGSPTTLSCKLRFSKNIGFHQRFAAGFSGIFLKTHRRYCTL